MSAVNQNAVSAIVGYQLTKGNFQNTSPNLPQRIAVLAEANDANQGTLIVDTNGNPVPIQITSSQQVGQVYGYGSPLHIISRILIPQNGGGLDGIPVWVYPQKKAVGATPTVIQVAPAGMATANTTHYLKIAGRENVDGTFYAINLVVGDTVAMIATKINTAINNVLGSPVISVDTGYNCSLTSKWSGLTSADLNVTIDTGNNAAGITYSVSILSTGAGTPDVTASLGLFGTNWNTIVINSYGLVTPTMNALESFNGIPDPTTPTGRYVGIVMKPFIALSGSLLEDPSTITDARLNNVTIAVCPAPLSLGFGMEAAANMAILFANVEQDTPHLDVLNMSYPDMPTPSLIGAMSDYNTRDVIIKKGCSTVDLISGSYVIKDFVTTYHPLGETPPQYRYCRNIMLDLNIRFTYYLLEQINVVGKAISADTDQVAVSNVIKPKMWKQILNQMALDLANRALIVDASFLQNGLTVSLSTSNPDRFETFFPYKRSGVVRIDATTAQAGFNFGTLN